VKYPEKELERPSPALFLYSGTNDNTT